MKLKPPKRPRNYCFACGKDNRHGMHLKFIHDPERKCFTCRFRLSKRYTGPPGYCHGGIIATILDDAMGKLNKVRSVTAVTAQMKIEFLRPVPLHESLRVDSRELRVRGRRHFNMAEIVNQQGQVLARSRGIFVAIDPKRLARGANRGTS
ncbi:MAG: PaaI family thioesterase [Terriglobales bacterium]